MRSKTIRGHGFFSEGGLIKNYKLKSIFMLPVLAIILCAAPSLLAAQNLHRQTTQITTLRLQELVSQAGVWQRQPASSVDRLQRIDPIRFKGRIRGLGPVKLVVNKRRNVTWRSGVTNSDGSKTYSSAAPVLLRGTVEIGRKHSDIYQGKIPVAVSVFDHDGDPRVRVSFIGKGRRLRPRFYQLQGVVSEESRNFGAGVERRIRIGLSHDQCGVQATSNDVVDSEGAQSVAPVSRSEDVSAQALTVEVATEADPEWFARYGSGSNDTIASLLDAVEVIYSRDLGVGIDITNQNVHSGSSPYDGMTSSDTILSTFQNYTNLNSHLGSADLYHLFSGKTFDQGVAGLAYLGVVCNAASFSYGISMDLISAPATTIVAAHEMGHNFGANHDETSALPGLMQPAVDVSSPYFSDLSISQINTHLNSVNSCLTSSGGGGGGGGGGTVTDWLLNASKQKVTRKKKNVVVQLVSESSGSGGSFLEVSLYRVKKAGNVLVQTQTTDADGNVVFGSFRKGKYIAVFESGGNSFTSGVVKIRKRRRS